MGFSLEVFMTELEALLDAPGLDDNMRLALLEKKVEAGRRYATECGQLESK